ncbi:hypothetical protein [Photobacterium atrarenae]|uniref:Chemotaxis protein n=1 Tax=Photobacterium atrarenae TaxID=865757 RepID=A0ABY5GI43_9GAMM|nr:hypothetical protein [Photobacterium atrarenae]UTV28958.1 hypothetical protein NNL38_06940 [Photobacterium atrarenae]
MSFEVIIEALKDSTATVGLVAVAMAVLSNVVTSQIIKPEKREEKAKDKLFKLLNSHLDAGHDIDLEFLKYVKSSVEREFETNIAISHLLEDFLVHKLNAQSESKHNIDYISKLKLLIEAEKQVKPFDSLPSEERRLLKGLKDSIEAKEATESTNYFIDELSTVLSVRSSEHQRTHQTNKWSVPLAIIGLVFTIVFGVMSIFSGPNEDAVASKIIERIEQQSPNK